MTVRPGDGLGAAVPALEPAPANAENGWLTATSDISGTTESAEPPTWVLVRGWSRNSGHWGAFPRFFERELGLVQPGARLVLLDLPGTGAWSQQASPTRVRDIVKLCRDELQRRGVAGPVSLLGMSLGAAVIADWATRYPSEVAAGVLINPSLRPFSEVFRRSMPMEYLALFLLSFGRFNWRRREERVLRLTTRLTAPQAVMERWLDLQRQHPVGVRNAVRQWWAGLRYRASRARPGAPMLLLCSRADGLVDWRCSQAISRAWGAPLRLHTKAGHDLALDDPLWVARSVVDWLRDRSLNGVEPGEWH
ncbi:alpha/beta fold hydrolase [Roseateles sp. BYS87W]|uniref:Alpha/beta fold hydrolase n=1 Tax=Pelomonas baiyunensis TaxID=3299026 RepID=A0ABW7GY04_9BURK